jgi:glycosyltransferase involved in cell wall biosynthesis
MSIMARIAFVSEGGDPTGQTPTKRHPVDLAERPSVPRAFLLDTLFDYFFDYSDLAKSPYTRGYWQKLPLPLSFRLAMEVWRRRDEFDVIISWSEKVSIWVTVLQFFGRFPQRHIFFTHWFSKLSNRIPLSLFHRSVGRFVTWTSVQKKYAETELGIEPDRITFLKHYADTVYWCPSGAIPENVDVVSAGAEMRDYDTLLEAMKQLPYNAVIATQVVRKGVFPFRKNIPYHEYAKQTPPNVLVKPHNPFEMRDLYESAKVIVVPLLQTDTDNGVTVILEAMCMGKAVVCSRVEGQVDVIQDGVNGIYVKQGDANELAAVINKLLNDPEKRASLGAAARKHVETHHRLEGFVEGVQQAIASEKDVFAKGTHKATE